MSTNQDFYSMSINELRREYNESYDNPIKRATVRQIIKEKYTEYKLTHNKTTMVSEKVTPTIPAKISSQSRSSRSSRSSQSRPSQSSQSRSSQSRSSYSLPVDDFYEFTDDDFLDANNF